jgi:hypothetical protein
MVGELVAVIEAAATRRIKTSTLELQKSVITSSQSTLYVPYFNDRVWCIGTDLLMLRMPGRRKTILRPSVWVCL